MSWEIGYDSELNRDIGYGVPAVCDHPDCDSTIDRGISHVCGEEPYGGEAGCGLYFCADHLEYAEHSECRICERCEKNEPPFPLKPDTYEWISWKYHHESWEKWRNENPDQVEVYRRILEKPAKLKLDTCNS